MFITPHLVTIKYREKAALKRLPRIKLFNGSPKLQAAMYAEVTLTMSLNKVSACIQCLCHVWTRTVKIFQHQKGTAELSSTCPPNGMPSLVIRTSFPGQSELSKAEEPVMARREPGTSLARDFIKEVKLLNLCWTLCTWSFGILTSH